MTTAQSIANLKARDILQPVTANVGPNDRVSAAERVMVSQRLTGLPVIENNRLVGVISRSDIARVHVLAESLDGQVAEELNWDETQADGFKHPPEEHFQGFQQRLEKLRVKDMMRSQVVT